MRSLLPIIAIPLVSLSLAAQTTGQLSGRVTTRDGKPVSQAVMTLKRTDINWTKEIKPTPTGTFLQVGLEPKEYDFSIQAEGFVQLPPARIKIPLGDKLVYNWVLLTPQEAVATGVISKAPGSEEADIATVAYNKGVALYNSQPPAFADALPEFEKAFSGFKESVEKAKDDKAKEETRKQLTQLERILGITQFEVGKAEEARKADLWGKAEPLLVAALGRNPKDQRILSYLIEVNKFKGNAAEAAKHQATLDQLMPPSAAPIYNNAVEAFNAGRNEEAKTYLLKAIQIEPKFTKSYYLLGMVEFGMNNLKGTKEAFLKYLEMDPNGEKAGEVKEMLADPSLKKIK